MTKTSKYLCAAAATLTLCAASAWSQETDGVYDAGFLLSANIQSVSSYTLYEGENPGDNSYSIPGTSPTPDTSGGIAANGGEFLGTFDPWDNGDTLTLNGGELWSYEWSNQATSAYLNYGVSGGGVSGAISLSDPGTNDYTSGTPSYNRQWDLDSDSINLLSGLAPGNYTLTFYSDANFSGNQTDYDSNGGKNYEATFTVIPEPSSVAMLLTSSLFGSFYLLRRRRR